MSKITLATQSVPTILTGGPVSRRAMLGGSIAAATATAATVGVALAPAPAYADPHPRWLAAALAIEGDLAAILAVRDIDEGDPETALMDEQDELLILIAETPARTREGALAQIRAACRYPDSGCAHGTLESVAAFLTQME